MGHRKSICTTLCVVQLWYLRPLRARPKIALQHFHDGGAGERDAEEAVRLGPALPRHYFNAARVHAQCPKGELRAMELIVQALRMLAVEQRPDFWSKQIRTDRALESIRGLPQFFQIEKELFPRK